MPTKKKRLMIALDNNTLINIDKLKRYLNTKQTSKVIVASINKTVKDLDL